MSTRSSLVALVATAGLLVGGLAGAESPSPRFEGADTTVAVARSSGRVAVLRGSRLQIFGAVDAKKAAHTYTLPVDDARLEEFHGNTVTYTAVVPGKSAPLHVAMDLSDVDLLTWPNEGLGKTFPNEASRLTLDGKGLYGCLTLSPEVRAFFGIPASTPDGARVVASYRFVVEKMLARASTDFRDGIALTPSDMVLTLRDGGLMRYDSGGSRWQTRGRGTSIRLLDVDVAAGRALALQGDGVLLGIDLGTGQTVWQWKGAAKKHSGGTTIRDGRLMPGGGVLLLLDAGGEATLNALDAAGGRLLGKVLPAGLDSRVSREGWTGQDGSLRGVWPVPTPGGAVLLLRGSDGWYVVPFPPS